MESRLGQRPGMSPDGGTLADETMVTDGRFLHGIGVTAQVMVSAGVTWTALVAAVVCFVMGLLFRVGRLRGMARYYRNPEFPAFARNCGVCMLPLSGVFFLWFLSGFLTSRAESVAAVLAFASLFAIAVCILMTYYPPNWLKPGWLRNGEAWNER
jgi:hypothetical protein